MVFVKKWPFFQLLFLRKYRPGNIFYDILNRKNAFLDYKYKKLKKSKNWHFSKVVNPWFWLKNGDFSNFFFLGNKCQENVFYDILERKNAVLGYNNKKFKIWPFFQLFFFMQCRTGKCLLRYSRKKKGLSRLHKQESQKVEKFTFF